MRNNQHASSTPLFLASIGAAVGTIVTIVAAVSPKVNDSQFNSMMQVATTAITAGLSGAAGIAQANSNTIDKVETIQQLDIEK